MRAKFAGEKDIFHGLLCGSYKGYPNKLNKIAATDCLRFILHSFELQNESSFRRCDFIEFVRMPF